MTTDRRARGRTWAVLGPTNTGKTHLALSRLMGHASGVMGFPLRLLARENYDKVVRIKGPGQVALLTGEEKIVPPHARYFLCTVESMPEALEGRVAFLAVDEIQLCADPERGHVFTDRLLHARGRHETLFLGADTIAPLLRRLVPEAEIETRPRFSRLTHSGYKNLSRLPAKSAVVAFSASEVYAIAELLRRQKGGAAVVLGALSPRTRNAQVALYQAGEVEYIVATDAIGMGLNMDVGHVAFAGLSKFDGRQVRPLTAAELAQIAGRAGRHRSDGTFGVTADAPPIDPAAVERLEAHAFPPLQRLYWRNSRLRFTSVDTLLSDLRRPAPARVLVRPNAAEDERALEFLAADPEVRALARGSAAVRLLWEVCQIPDFKKTLSDAHPRLLGEIFRHLAAEGGQLPEDWVDRQVQRLDRSDGDIDVLTQRIAGIRTWTYVAHRSEWLPRPAHWQSLTRAVEDKLSDALHERLTQRFVDRRTSALAKRLRDRGELLASVARSGDVLVEGHYVGRLEAFHFAADDAESPHAARAVTAAATKALRGEMVRRVAALREEPDDAFALAEDGRLLWRDAPVARLRPGPAALRPRVEPLPFDLLDATQREKVGERLSRWLEAHRRQVLGSLVTPEPPALTGAARGLWFQLAEGLGSLPRHAAEEQIESLAPADRRALRGLGVRLARASVYVPALLGPGAVTLRATLWTVFHRPDPAPARPPPDALWVDVEPGAAPAFYEAVGYRVCGRMAVRVDALERVATAAWEYSAAAGRGAAFAVGAPLLALLGASTAQMAEVLEALGYATEMPVGAGGEAGLTARRLAPRRRGASKAGPGGGRRRKEDASSPFARLRDVTVKR